jgi:hypothetical protein
MMVPCFLTQDEFDDKVPEGFHIVARLQTASNSKLLFVKWLPFVKLYQSSTLNKLLVGVDTKGILHIFDSHGHLLVSHPTGHKHAVTGMYFAAIITSKCICPSS